ncbi:MAG: VTC domain-containing protein [Planctomycetota bacterium]|jgi:hypothetical protein
MIRDLIKRISGKKVSVVPLRPIAGQKEAPQASESVVKSAVDAAAPIDRTLWCRYEMKYVISESKAAAIQNFIRPYIELDRYSKLQPNGFYPIVSLYLDSNNMQLCIESLRGVLKRFKLRIRSYSDNPEYPRFFEIKRRSNRVIIKSRARVRTQDVPILLEGRYVPPIGNYKQDIDAIRQFQLYMRSVHAKPKVLIKYQRCAYEGKMHNRVRVTFDKKLCYKVTSDPEVLLGRPGFQYNSATLRGVILEIKFTGRYPAWLGRMATTFGLRQRSMSKYASSIKQACSLGFCGPTIPVKELMYG